MQKYGFSLVEEKELAEVGGTARLWRHDACGAEILSITNADENKCFGVSFYTPPTDSTGVAHILEHSVLCGSKKYPVKEPFVELLKGSLQTFLNAFTFPDKTCYPVASANLQDFYNLVDVYLDAVFHPLLAETTFAQEGWHVDAESADGPWIYKGVVYNEMKGVYSSPESILAEKSQQAIFPDNLYSLDSGGNPEDIPNLTWQAFRDFHARYYQPGNARFFFWGDDPEDKRLQIVSEAVAGASPVDHLPAVPLQQKFAKPRFIEVPYAATEDENRSLFTTGWLLGERGDVALAMKMEMLEHILEGLPGSPLRRAMMESGLGEDTIGCGLETDLRQMYYSTGLKGIEPADVEKAEQLLLSTLRDLTESGINPQAVEAAVNTVEFAYRENNSGRFPRGLAAMIQALSTWLYGENPLAPLAWEAPLAQIKSELAQGEKVFEKAIKEYFLDNTSRARVTLLPDEKLAAKRLERERARLAEIQEETSPAGRAALVQETEILRGLQLAPDKPEDLARIPALKVADLPLKNAHLPITVEKGQQTFISHELPTRGVAYASLLLPIDRIPLRLIPFLPLFCRSLTELGSERRDYSDLGMLIAAKTGGVGATTIVGARRDTRMPYAFLSIGGKAVYEKLPDLFGIFREILLEPQKDEGIIINRLSQMILEDKARLEYGLQAAGHAAVSARLRAHFSGDGHMNELMAGISQLEHLRQLAKTMEKDPAAVVSSFREIAQILVSSQNAIFDLAAEGPAMATGMKLAKNLLAELPPAPAFVAGVELKRLEREKNLPAGEAFITPGQVNYVGKAANLFELGYKYQGSANVIMRWLRMGRLWEEVRVAGGAYGVFCNLDNINGTMVCASYRDPNVDKTLSAYDGLGPYLRDFNPNAAQLSQAIIGAVGDVDAYMLPDAKAVKALALWLAGIDPALRQQRREEMLATTARDFQDFAGVLEAAAPTGAICVLGGETTRQAAIAHGWTSRKLI